jgi:hypothetical protein
MAKTTKLLGIPCISTIPMVCHLIVIGKSNYFGPVVYPLQHQYFDHPPPKLLSHVFTPTKLIFQASSSLIWPNHHQGGQPTRNPIFDNCWEPLFTFKTSTIRWKMVPSASFCWLLCAQHWEGTNRPLLISDPSTWRAQFCRRGKK